jgi:hypothetical protein
MANNVTYGDATILRRPIDEPDAVAELVARSTEFDTELIVENNRVVVWRCDG